MTTSRHSGRRVDHPRGEDLLALLPLDHEPAPTAPHEFMATVGSSGSDEAFLNDVDLALRSPQVRELIPLVAATSRVRTAAVDLW